MISSAAVVSGAKPSSAGAGPGPKSSIGSLPGAGGAEISSSPESEGEDAGEEVVGAGAEAEWVAFGEDAGADDDFGDEAAFGDEAFGDEAFGADADDLGDADGATSAMTIPVMATKMRATTIS